MKKTGVAFIVLLLMCSLLGPAGMYAEAGESDSTSAADAVTTFTVKIEDPVLEQAIRHELNIEDRPLQYQDLQQLTSLYPQTEQKMKSLKGLEWATNLTSLMVPDQQITDLSPLQNLYRLRFLGLNGNQITNVCPIAGLNQIDRLVIYDNQISDIHCLSRLTGLTDLLADHNQIKDISALSQLPIRWLNLEGNPITDITPVGRMNSLTHLNVDTKPLNESSQTLLSRLDQSGVMVNRFEKDGEHGSGISVMLDGQRVLFEQAPVVEDGNTLVPFRPLFEKLGYTIQWDQASRTVTGEKKGTKLTLKAGDKQAFVDGKPYALEAAPQIVNGSTLVPVRFVGEASKYDVTWEQATKTVYIAQPYDLKSPDGRAQMHVSGKWRSLNAPVRGIQSYAMYDGSMLMTNSDPKAYLPSVESLDSYEQAVLGNLSTRGYKDYSEPKKITVNGMPARQFVYSVSHSSKTVKILATIIEGKYNFFRVAFMVEEDKFPALEPELQQMLQSFQELKTVSEGNQEKFGAMEPTDRLLDAVWQLCGFIRAWRGQKQSMAGGYRSGRGYGQRGVC
ncbi:stalk domain-containing protein [Paenibacillus rigui]|uniref:Copper amine oxidase-like N-terminal domain-containing protein n=1 Tax=Paenibacillus rigui TaxID=554312 RepID=A0A229UHK4_9BACL|nr:stalk domain-containing protein [Paenibacillus rigui]OXM82850.1 hypothetical protein CF651_28850 [Paenibacillus rigui]